LPGFLFYEKKILILSKSHICRFTAFVYQPKPLNLVIQFRRKLNISIK
jgi:hypothetical protein